VKLQFKEQKFQTDAVKAVVDCFSGQPIKTNRFTLERTKDILQKTKNASLGLTTLAFEDEILENIGYRNSALRITDNQILENIKKTQRYGNLLEVKEIEKPKVKLGHNLTIEMETGTGKTYTYIRTMYELHKHYGWSKFIVIIPSIAIREGVHKSFELMQDHFMQLYGHKITPFIYNSARPQDIESFASDSRISVMIINTQAFNANPNAKGKDARRIHRELDQFGSRKPIEIISQTNPILIIDEPQSAGGDKTLAGMSMFKPLFTLRYSATHKDEFNKIYRLDALDAYNQKLVKKIQVKGINIKGSTGTTGYLYLEQIVIGKGTPEALVEYEIRTKTGVKKIRKKLTKGANLFELSGEMPQYKNQTIQDVDGYFNRITVGGHEIYAGDAIGDVDEKAFRRIQIRETILSHLQKEKQLYAKGIKVLTLFFIDSVEKYRVYDENGEESVGEYAKIFEEEYNKLKNEFLDLFHQEYNEYLKETDPSTSLKAYMPTDYVEYLKRDKGEIVHNGYFSIDKKKRLVDPKTGRKKKGEEAQSDDISAYELIMKDKERLLSFEEPTRFIFSHSALKEGWDNPNVFQICALKHSEATIRRRQEVGRGMRLCVNKHGIRQDFETVGEEVHEINKLTVIASESYEDFAKGLQSEIAETLKDRPQKAEVEFFIGKIVTDALGTEIRIDKPTAKKLNKYLYKNDILDEDDKITDIGRTLIEENRVPLPENLETYRNDITKLLKSVYTGEVVKPENDRSIVTVGVNKNFFKKEFQELWNKINLKTIYEVKFDTAKLISDSVIKVNADLHIAARKYEVKSGTLKETTKEELENKQAFHGGEIEHKELTDNIYTDTVYDIIGEIVNKTNLTRKTVATILKKISPKKFYLIQKNPEEFIAKSSNLINEVKAKLVISNITYHKTEERHDARTVFTNDKFISRKNNILQKHIYDYLTTDSDVETDFAQALENLKEVTVYAKLPKSFYITYPGANGEAKYNPDWAVVFDKDKVRHIYFIAETKGSTSDMNLRGIENLKIESAKEHFRIITDMEVKFDKVDGYEKLMEIVK
jgi:type III restriction enzyme